MGGEREGEALQGPPTAKPLASPLTGFTARRGVHGIMTLYEFCIIIIIIINLFIIIIIHKPTSG